MMMARQFERGFSLIETCEREAPRIADAFPQSSPMHAALNELAAAARRAQALLDGQGRGGAPPLGN